MYPAPVRRRRTGPGTLPAALLTVLLAAAYLVLVPGPPPARAAPVATETSTEPLRVVLTTVSPSVVPTSGPLTLAGRVTNVGDEQWRTVNMSAIASRSPITTSHDLAEAVATPATAFVGTRFATPSSFQGVGDLDPGESATFRLRIPRSELPIGDAAGVYWIGVHALATNDDGRDVEGRARTFIPLVSAPRSRATVSVVVPFREAVDRHLDLRISDPAAWRALLSDDGRLGRLLALTESAGTAPVSLLVDPAVLGAVQTLGSGNVARRTTSAPPSSSPSASSGSDSDSSGSSDSSSGSSDGPDDAASVGARDWLNRIRALASGHQVLGLGYADPDTAALSDGAPALLDEAAAQSAAAFERLGIDAVATTAPADGLLPVSAVSALDPRTRVLLSAAARTGDAGASGDSERLVAPGGQTVQLADTDPAGPAPAPTTSALAERQWIVSEAALRAQAGDTDPLVVSLPADWDPGSAWSSADFFGGLQRPWLDLAPLDTSSTGSTGTSGQSVEALGYPASAARAQLSAAQLSAARDLAATSTLYADTLSRPGSTRTQLERLALGAASYHERGDVGAAARARQLGAGLTARLSGVRVVGSDFVTLSGSGTIQVTLVNDLDESARVGLSVSGAPGLRIKSPGLLTLPPGQRTTVPLPVSSDGNGVRAVDLTPVTAEGDAVGTPLRFSVRSSQVGLLVWAVMAAAGLLLVVMIGRRLVRRGLRRRSAS